MKRAAFSYAISVGVVAVMLAGCGGSQPPYGAPGRQARAAIRSRIISRFYSRTCTKQWSRVPAGVTNIYVGGRGAAGGGGDGGSVYVGRGGALRARTLVVPVQRRVKGWRSL